MKIYVSGSIAYDRIMDFPGKFSDHILPDKLHILNVCFTVNGLQEKFGGTAGNIAYSLALLGEKPVILSTIGRDFHAYFKWLEECGITPEGIKVIVDEFTAGAYITTDLSDNQITGFNPGAMKLTSGYQFPDLDPEDTIAILAPGNLTDMKEYAKFYKKAGIRYICDPGQSLTAWDGNELREWIDGSYMLITNDYELELVQKMTGLDKKGLTAITGTVITTLGEKGVNISTGDGDISVPAAKAGDVADPTGAGDAFRSGLILGLVQKRSIVDCAKLGAIAAVYAVEKYGTQEHSYTVEEFKKRYEENYG